MQTELKEGKGDSHYTATCFGGKTHEAKFEGTRVFDNNITIS